MLVVARVLLGFGTCAGYPAAMYLIRSEADRTGLESPAAILTILAISTQTIAVVGPTLGGLLVGVAGWPAVFAVNVPLAVLGLVVGCAAAAARRAGRAGSGTDRPGIGLFAAMLVTLLLFLMDPGRWWLAAVALAAGAVFAVREQRSAQPFLDLRIFGGNVALLVTYARMLLAAIVSYAFLYGFTQWLEEGRGLSPSVTGLGAAADVRRRDRGVGADRQARGGPRQARSSGRSRRPSPARCCWSSTAPRRSG